jgi:hypothetical protein
MTAGWAVTPLEVVRDGHTPPLDALWWLAGHP